MVGPVPLNTNHKNHHQQLTGAQFADQASIDRTGPDASSSSAVVVVATIDCPSCRMHRGLATAFVDAPPFIDLI